MEECLLIPCNHAGSETVQLTKKGLNTIVEISKFRKDGIAQKCENLDDLVVHVLCRKDYTRKKIIPVKLVSTLSRSSGKPFSFKQECLFCGRICANLSKLRKPALKEVWSAATTLSVINSIRKFAKKRGECKWAAEVMSRLSGVIDLVAEEGRYHRYCYQRFKVLGSHKPGTSKPSPKNFSLQKDKNFERLCEYIEANDECQFTINELNAKLAAIDPVSPPYSSIHLKRKLKKRYGENISISYQPGKHGVLCFSGFVNKIITDKWYTEKKSNGSEERKRIIMTAANLIRQEIFTHHYDCDSFPTIEEIQKGNSQLVGKLLKLFTETLLMAKKGKQISEDPRLERKAVCIQHAILTALRPRSFVSPIQTGLSIYLHRKFGSKTLIDLISNLGFCASYSEAVKYEVAITTHAEPVLDDNAYVQFVYDNADHNINTLDGHQTFHAMGGIECVTPASAVHTEKPALPRNILGRTFDLNSYGQTKLMFYKQPYKSGYSNITVLDVTEISLRPISADIADQIDSLWMAGTWLSIQPWCSWNGFMEKVYSSETTFLVSSVLPKLMPFINCDPNNLSTIFTSLLQAAEEGKKNCQNNVMVTYDQPLYAKAKEIVLAAPPENPIKSVIVRLGGFHLLLSYLGTIGEIMGDSGLETLWQEVYAKNSVPHMLRGRAYSRAVRAHLLTLNSLITLLLEETTVDETLFVNLKQCYNSLFKGETTVENVFSSHLLENLTNLLKGIMEKFANEGGRTAKLWIQYIDMIKIMCLFIRAERCGDWQLHLYSVQQMLTFFHAAGHFNYAKYAHVYLQEMIDLENKMKPSEFETFTKQGCFSIRRSNKFWAGIWSDMTIEQVLMRQMKSSGGLTHGRGLSPTTLAKWIHTMPFISSVIGAVESFTGVQNSSSEQHVDLRTSRQDRDIADINKFLKWFKIHHPFKIASPHLISLSTGIVGDSTINCERAAEVGLVSLQKSVGKLFSEVKYQRKDKVKSLASVNKGVSINNEEIVINSNQLFHRMLCTVRTDEELANGLSYELASYPPALFDGKYIRKSQKSSLIRILESFESAENPIPHNCTYVIDGGHLLHKVVWQRPATYKDICDQYVSYVLQHYGRCYVIFDGYDGGPGIKDVEHLRRGGLKKSIEVDVGECNDVFASQHDFLSNEKNKSSFIRLLKDYLKSAGCEVNQAVGDADTLIVSEAIKIADSCPSVIVGEDSDLFAILIAHATKECYILKPGKKGKYDRVYNIQELQKSLGAMKEYMLVLHAFTGCDSTSAPFRKGKKRAFSLFSSDQHLRDQMDVFNNASSSSDSISEAGEKFFLAMYGAKGTLNLDKARHRLYLSTVGKQKVSSTFNLAVLPPTSDAARHHSLRVYLQVQQWRFNYLLPTEWGWKLSGGKLLPIPTSRNVVPDGLLKLVMCNCKNSCEKFCDCRRSGLECSSMCGQCAGSGCSNSSIIIDEAKCDEADESEGSSLNSADVDEINDSSFLTVQSK